MDFSVSHEDGPKLVKNPVNNKSKYNGYRRAHDGNMNKIRLQLSHSRTTHEGNTSTTRLLHNVVLML